MIVITIASGEIRISKEGAFADKDRTPVMTLAMNSHLDVLVEVDPGTGLEVELSTDGKSVLIS